VKKNVWSMKLRVPGLEVDQREPGKRWCKKAVRHMDNVMDCSRWRKLIVDG